MMRINILIINIIMLVMAGFLHSQSVKEEAFKTNIDIYTGILNKNLDVLENRLVLLGKDKIYCVSIAGKKSNSEYLYTVIKQKFYNYRIISDVDSSSSDYKVLFENVTFKTGYSKLKGSVLNNSRIERQIEISYKNSIRAKGKDSVIYNNIVIDVNKDEFYLERVDEAEKGEYDFLKGTLPERSLLERLFLPGIVVLTSAAAIILFFVIRSK
jgi:hypothetical protein